jgi:hypothetical protein
MRTILAIILFGMAATASAQPNANLPQNRQPQTEERYQPRNQLADVRLDAGRGRAFIRVPQTTRPLDYLELRAGRQRIQLDDVQIRFADGTSIRTGDRGVIEPFQGRVVNLPRRSSAVTAIIPTYRTLGRHYADARLQVFGVPQHFYGTRDRYDRDYRDRYNRDRYPRY